TLESEVRQVERRQERVVRRRDGEDRPDDDQPDDDRELADVAGTHPGTVAGDRATQPALLGDESGVIRHRAHRPTPPGVPRCSMSVSAWLTGGSKSSPGRSGGVPGGASDTTIAP